MMLGSEKVETVSAKASKASSSSSSSSSDQNYGVETSKLAQLRTEKPFLKDPKYFKNVQISPSATMKMMMHVQSGVEKGIKKSLTGKPTEVMGLLVGHQDTNDPHCLIISDAQALPIEGFETSVVAQSDETLTYQINLANLNERTRHSSEKFCGWYHSHPFDLEEYSHCYLSNTDVQTQLAWQRATEKDGDPWLAIVIDPLRSVAKGYPNLESFRVYPPEYTSVPNETPDGTVIADEKTRLQLWGNCWNRYYKLNTSFFMSTLASNVLGMLKNNFLWQNNFTSTPLLDTDATKSQAERMHKIASDIESVADGRGRSGEVDPNEGSREDRARGGTGQRAASLARVAGAGCTLSSDHCMCSCSQMAKLALFGNPNSKVTRDLLALDIANKREEKGHTEVSSVFSTTLTQAQAVSATDSSINLSGRSMTRALRRI